jgi:hypothetical protein
VPPAKVGWKEEGGRRKEEGPTHVSAIIMSPKTCHFNDTSTYLNIVNTIGVSRDSMNIQSDWQLKDSPGREAFIESSKYMPSLSRLENPTKKQLA